MTRHFVWSRRWNKNFFSFSVSTQLNWLSGVSVSWWAMRPGDYVWLCLQSSLLIGSEHLVCHRICSFHTYNHTWTASADIENVRYPRDHITSTKRVWLQRPRGTRGDNWETVKNEDEMIIFHWIFMRIPLPAYRVFVSHFILICHKLN